MPVDPKSPLGIGHGGGYAPKTSLGRGLQSAHNKGEGTTHSSPKLYRGWLSDIRLPLGDRKAQEDNLPGTWCKIYFDSPTMRRVWGDNWFRLSVNPAALLQEFGTEDSIRNARLRVEMTVFGLNTARATVVIIGDPKNELTHRRYEETPVMCFLDLVHGLSSGQLP